MEERICEGMEQRLQSPDKKQTNTSGGFCKERDAHWNAASLSGKRAWVLGWQRGGWPRQSGSQQQGSGLPGLFAFQKNQEPEIGE